MCTCLFTFSIHSTVQIRISTYACALKCMKCIEQQHLYLYILHNYAVQDLHVHVYLSTHWFILYFPCKMKCPTNPECTSFVGVLFQVPRSQNMCVFMCVCTSVFFTVDNYEDVSVSLDKASPFNWSIHINPPMYQSTYIYIYTQTYGCMRLRMCPHEGPQPPSIYIFIYNILIDLWLYVCICRNIDILYTGIYMEETLAEHDWHTSKWEMFY